MLIECFIILVFLKFLLFFENNLELCNSRDFNVFFCFVFSVLLDLLNKFCRVGLSCFVFFLLMFVGFFIMLFIGERFVIIVLLCIICICEFKFMSFIGIILLLEIRIFFISFFFDFKNLLLFLIMFVFFGNFFLFGM